MAHGVLEHQDLDNSGREYFARIRSIMISTTILSLGSIAESYFHSLVNNRAFHNFGLYY